MKEITYKGLIRKQLAITKLELRKFGRIDDHSELQRTLRERKSYIPGQEKTYGIDKVKGSIFTGLNTSTVT